MDLSVAVEKLRIARAAKYESVVIIIGSDR